MCESAGPVTSAFTQLTRSLLPQTWTSAFRPTEPKQKKHDYPIINRCPSEEMKEGGTHPTISIHSTPSQEDQTLDEKRRL
ncbi:hypothetical protein BLNAU_12326 [Blattamonas nauphoetae]|uniref:Uncharacterized protein n=1 Tax=Blattamonas nauphoetae TaxID=2049346 RepID=A0ABQ9XPX6_9EUKA|nr:hypothetical protein BLNAU_12326 [Blattamonas nauphoetae]